VPYGVGRGAGARRTLEDVRADAHVEPPRVDVYPERRAHHPGVTELELLAAELARRPDAPVTFEAKAHRLRVEAQERRSRAKIDARRARRPEELRGGLPRYEETEGSRGQGDRAGGGHEVTHKNVTSVSATPVPKVNSRDFGRKGVAIAATGYSTRRRAGRYSRVTGTFCAGGGCRCDEARGGLAVGTVLRCVGGGALLCGWSGSAACVRNSAAWACALRCVR
jgi:hypothetical protein